MADNAPRISPQEAREHMRSGALLICAYDDDEKCRSNHLEGALTFNEFRAQRDALPRDRELIFYCA
jgi:hypothetical protein